MSHVDPAPAFGRRLPDGGAEPAATVHSGLRIALPQIGLLDEQRNLIEGRGGDGEIHSNR
jgi:hypothetical protein